MFTAGLQADKTIGLGSLYNGKSGQTFPGGVKVANSDGDSCDSCTVKYAMTKSINTVFYQMAVQIGPQKVVDAAHAAGIPKDLLKQVQGGIALGAHPILRAKEVDEAIMVEGAFVEKFGAIRGGELEYGVGSDRRGEARPLRFVEGLGRALDGASGRSWGPLRLWARACRSVAT